jgi:NAD(P)H-hydrate repair Nnr-like enzyme with NAD(P)H-hydrate dehydratase domain
LWSRPENRLHAGKLLIIGGNGYEFKAPANAYGDALDAGVGVARVILPASLQKTVARIFPEAEFAPHTPSGSFARSSLAQFLDGAAWADGVLLAGGLGRNSETAIALESLLQKYQGLLVLANDAVEYCLDQPTGCLDRPDTGVVCTTAQLQKMAAKAQFATAFTSDMSLMNMVEALHEFSLLHTCNLIVWHDGAVIVASKGQISSTPADEFDPTDTAARAAVWWLQNPSKPYEALTTSLVA